MSGKKNRSGGANYFINKNYKNAANDLLHEELGQLIDDIDNLAHGLSLPMSDKFHIDMLKSILPEKVEQFKKVFEKITGENPWK